MAMREWNVAGNGQLGSLPTSAGFRGNPQQQAETAAISLLSGASSVPKSAIEPASVATTKSTPNYTHSGTKQPAVRGMLPSIAALSAANNLRMRRLRLIISA